MQSTSVFIYKMTKTILLITLIICSNSWIAFSQKCFGLGEIWMDCGCNKNCDNWEMECKEKCSPGCYCQSQHARIEGHGGNDPCIPVECCPIETCVKDCEENYEKCEAYLSQL